VSKHGDLLAFISVCQSPSSLLVRKSPANLHGLGNYRKCLCIDGVVSALRVVEEKTVGEIEPSEAYRTADIPFQKI
jgi:hypothetical protein